MVISLQDFTLWRNTLFIFLGVIFLRKARELYRHAQRKKFPPIPGIQYIVPIPHWLFGHLLEFDRSPTWLECQQKLSCPYAGGNAAYVSTFWLFHRPSMGALHADAVHHILRRSHDRIALAAFRKHYSKLLGRNTLVFARGKKWTETRSLVHVAFVDEALQHARRTILKTSLRIEQAMVDTIAIQTSSQQTGWNVEAYQFCKMATLDVFGMTALGYDFGCSSSGIMTSEHSLLFRQTEFFQQELTRRCFQERWNIFAQCYWIPTPRNIRHYWELQSYRSLLMNIVQTRRAEFTRQQEQGKSKVTLPNVDSGADEKSDHESATTATSNVGVHSIKTTGCGDNLTLLDFLLRGADDKKGNNSMGSLSDEYVSEFLTSVMFGGYDTTALALSYTLYLLAKHPEHQDRCAKEAIHVLGESCTNNTPLDSFLATTDLPYCYAALLESLRYYPPIALASRDFTKPIPLDMHVDPDTRKRSTVEIPAEVRFIVCFYCVNHSEFNYPRPDDYLPERWVQPDENGELWQARTAENGQGGTVPLATESRLITFSAGARSCVGRPLALRMVTTLLAVMVRSFHVELADPDYEIELKRSGLIAKGGIPLVLQRRETPPS